MQDFHRLQQKRILLIDDDEWIRDAMAAFFESEGSTFRALETAGEGLAELSRHDYDIIIVDYRLPDMDGVRLLEQIRGGQPAAIRLMITAYGNERLPVEARRAGAHAYIPKPFDMADIENALNRLMTDRGSAGPSGPASS